MTDIDTVTSDEVRPVFSRIMSGLVDECSSFGQLNHAAGAHRSEASRYLDRLRMIVRLSTAFEHAVGLRFSTQSHLPFHWINAGWPTDPGTLSVGYSGESGAPPPSCLLNSYFGEWTASAEDSGGRSSIRPQKAVFLRWRAYGMGDAVKYLYDLWVDGAIADIGAAFGALRGLGNLAEYEQERERCPLIPRGFDIHTAAPALTDAWSPSALDRSSPKLDGSAIRIDVLISAVTQEINHLRQARDLNAWIQSYARVSRGERLLRKAHSLFPARSLAMKTLISQYEEISCDAGPLLWRIKDNVAFERVDGRDVLDTIEGYLNALERSGRAGILQQRVARPNVLGSEGDPARQTVTWSQLSVRHVAAFAAAFPPLGTPECMTSVAVRSDNPVADWKSAVVRAAQANQDNPVAAAELAAGSLVDFPYSAFLRWEYAIAMDSQDEVQSALELLIEALILQPDNDGIWSSLSVVLDRDGRPRDSAVARIVAEHFVTTSGNG